MNKPVNANEPKSGKESKQEEHDSKPSSDHSKEVSKMKFESAPPRASGTVTPNKESDAKDEAPVKASAPRETAAENSKETPEEVEAFEKSGAPMLHADPKNPSTGVAKPMLKPVGDGKWKDKGETRP